MAKTPADESDDGGGGGYTAALSYDPSRLRSRTNASFCLLNLAPHSGLLDGALGCLSAVTAAALATFATCGTIALLPSVAATKLLGVTNYFNRGIHSAATKNISNDGGGSRTAIKTLSARAQFSRAKSGGAGPDDLAPAFLRRMSLFGKGIPGSGWFSRVFLFLVRWNFYLTGRMFNDQAAWAINRCLGYPFPLGEVAFLQVRTCWLDDCVETFVRKHNARRDSSSTMGHDAAKKKVNVVVLGAGYDSRCYRLRCLAERGASTYEVDAPGTQAEKLRVLRESRTDTGDTVFVSCDFESEDWLERLRETGGFDADLPTLIVWEGVSMYLDRDVVMTTISKVAELGRGSCIGFDYVDASWGLSPSIVKLTTKAGEPWKFGMESGSGSVRRFVSECNDGTSSKSRVELRMLDHLRHEELIKRYLPKHFDGRPYGFIGDFGGLLLIGTE